MGDIKMIKVTFYANNRFYKPFTNDGFIFQISWEGNVRFEHKMHKVIMEELYYSMLEFGTNIVAFVENNDKLVGRYRTEIFVPDYPARMANIIINGTFYRTMCLEEIL